MPEDRRDMDTKNPRWTTKDIVWTSVGLISFAAMVVYLAASLVINNH